MNEQKPWYASMGVWGSAIAILAPLLSMLGYSMADADRQQLSVLLGGIGGAVAGIVALYGRVTATKRIGGGS